MAPHKIMSSRLFQTRLSHPPRTIAFVRYDRPISSQSQSYRLHRLETRTAAEETIERLHGRMVRGWKDPGCRISVRFADTAEQRELRVSIVLPLSEPLSLNNTLHSGRNVWFRETSLPHG